MSSWHSYSSIYNLGHRAIAELLQGEVLVEEKIDGSQFSFGIFSQSGGAVGGQGLEFLDGPPQLRVRSKGAEMNVEAPEKMFTRGVDYVKSIEAQLTPGWTYRGEYLAKPHHNALSYDRIPTNHVMLFDVETDESTFLSHEDKFREAERIGLECVPLLHMGRIADLMEFRTFLDTPSCLGGQKIEGVVVKPANYDLFGRDKKVLMGKFVSEAFKEVHAKTWGEANPGTKDILQLIGSRLNTQARWQKAVQHLKEAGKIEDSPRDIGPLMKEIPEDVRRECEAEIKQWLWEWAWPHLKRMVARGAPEWYKESLLKLQFERGEMPAFMEQQLYPEAPPPDPLAQDDGTGMSADEKGWIG